jgi:ubiquinone/menaquinone biosynthesis C-methylase UbiE
MTHSNDKTRLSELLLKIDRAIDTSRLINEVQTADHIKKYYHVNRPAYKLFHSHSGYMHMGLTYEGEYKYSDQEAQLRMIESHLKELKATKVLELGAGMGANSAYLSKREPDIAFHSIDLSALPLRKFRNISNYAFGLADYHDLSQFSDNSFDYVFVIEALCYSVDKEKVLREVHRVLRKGGRFFVIDGYASMRDTELDALSKKAKQLVEKSMAVEVFEHVDDFEETAIKTGFNILHAEDLSANTIPTMRKLQHLSRGFFKVPAITKIISKIVPFEMYQNSVAGLLMPEVIDLGICSYVVHILEKK